MPVGRAGSNLTRVRSAEMAHMAPASPCVKGAVFRFLNSAASIFIVCHLLVTPFVVEAKTSAAVAISSSLLRTANLLGTVLDGAVPFHTMAMLAGSYLSDVDADRLHLYRQTGALPG